MRFVSALSDLARVRLSVCFALAFILIGCGGGGGSSTPESLALKPGVLIANDNQPFQVVGSDDDTVTVSGDASGIEPGNVIVSGEGPGFLRLVDSVVPQGGTTLLNTSQATFDDAIESANFKRTISVGPNQIAEFIPAGPGITLEPGQSLPPGRGTSGIEIKLNLAEFELYDSGQGKITASGDVKLRLGVDFDFQWWSGKRYVKWVSNIQATGEMSLSATLESVIPLRKVFLGRLVGRPILVVVFGFPIVFEPVVDLYSVVEGSYKVGASLTSSASIKAELGGYFNDGQYGGIASISRSVDLIPQPNFFGSVTLGYTPCRPEAAIKIYGVAGPYAAIDAPRLELEVSRQLNPAGARIRGSAVFKGSAGLKMGIFGRDILDHDFGDLISVQVDLFNRFYPDNGGVSVGVQ